MLVQVKFGPASVKEKCILDLFYLSKHNLTQTKRNFEPFASHQGTVVDLLIRVHVKFGPMSVKKENRFGHILNSPRKFGLFYITQDPS